MCHPVRYYHYILLEHFKNNSVRTPLHFGIIQLEPRESKVPVIAGRMQQKLRNLTFGARVNSSIRNTCFTRMIKCDCGDRLEGFGSAVPSVFILVNCWREGGDIELVGSLAP